MDNQDGSGHGRRTRVIFAWLGAAAATVGILVGLLELVDLVRSPDQPTGDPVASETAGNGDERYVQAGDCVENAGTEETPVYNIVACRRGAQGVMRVVARIDRTVTDEAEIDPLCEKQGVEYTDYHYSNWDRRPDYPDIVFCLRPE